MQLAAYPTADDKERSKDKNCQDRQTSRQPEAGVSQPIPGKHIENREADERRRKCIGQRRHSWADEQPDRCADERERCVNRKGNACA